MDYIVVVEDINVDNVLDEIACFLVGGRSKFVVGEGIRWVKELYKIILWFLFQFQDIPAGQCML